MSKIPYPFRGVSNPENGYVVEEPTFPQTPLPEPPLDQEIDGGDGGDPPPDRTWWEFRVIKGQLQGFIDTPVPAAVYEVTLRYYGWTDSDGRRPDLDREYVTTYTYPLEGKDLDQYNSLIDHYETKHYSGSEKVYLGTTYISGVGKIDLGYRDVPIEYDYQAPVMKSFTPNDDYYSNFSQIEGVKGQTDDVASSIVNFELQAAMGYSYYNPNIHLDLNGITTPVYNGPGVDWTQIITDVNQKAFDQIHAMIDETQRQIEANMKSLTLSLPQSGSGGVYQPPLSTSVYTIKETNGLGNSPAICIQQGQFKTFSAAETPGAIGVVNQQWYVPPSGSVLSGKQLMQGYKIPTTLNPSIDYQVIVIQTGTGKPYTGMPVISGANIQIYLP